MIYDKFRLTLRRWLIIYDLAGINGNELVGPFNIGYDMKRNSKTDCRLLNQYLIGSPKILPFAKLRFPILQQYKAPSHASKYTIRWLVHQGVLGKHIWPNLQVPTSTILLRLHGSSSWKENYELGWPFNSKQGLRGAGRVSESNILDSLNVQLTSFVDTRQVRVL